MESSVLQVTHTRGDGKEAVEGGVLAQRWGRVGAVSRDILGQGQVKGASAALVRPAHACRSVCMHTKGNETLIVEIGKCESIPAYSRAFAAVHDDSKRRNGHKLDGGHD